MNCWTCNEYIQGKQKGAHRRHESGEVDWPVVITTGVTATHASDYQNISNDRFSVRLVNFVPPTAKLGVYIRRCIMIVLYS